MDIDDIRRRTWAAIAPLAPAQPDAATFRHLFLSARRTDAGRTLPPYYLIYFVLVDLLGFPNNGQWEKTAWSVTVALDDTPFLIEHRKFGLGIFGIEGPDMEGVAARIAICLHRAVKAARPYFDWRARQAASQSHLNVVNRSRDLLDHAVFHLDHYDARIAEAEARKDEVVETQVRPNAWTIRRPAY